MLPKMSYRLGLDLGSNSIGWCMVRLDKNKQPCAVIRAGVRVFPDGRNPKDGSSLAVTRRQARQMRRRRDRLLKRKARLLNALVELGFFPANEPERRALAGLDPYVLRKRGLDHALTGPEFGRALFHINQRRGFKSNRRADAKDAEAGKIKTAIATLRERLDAEGCRTLGEWLANRHAQKLSVRARLRGGTPRDRAYDFYVDRAMVEHEFDLLWEAQSRINPALFSEHSRAVLKDILLFQRNLRPVKPGRCTLLPDEERAPLALPSVQRFRIYQELNNLRLVNDDLSEAALSKEQRDLIAALLEARDMKFDTLRRKLRLPGHLKFNLEDGKRDRLKGNATSITLAKDDAFGERWHDLDAAAQDAVVEKLLGEERENALIEWLRQEVGLDERTAEQVANKRLPEGYGSLCRTAVSRVLPELQRDVVVYSEAVSRAGLGSHSALSLAERYGEVMAELPYYGEALQRHVGFGTGNPEDDPEKRFGKIANPTVHIGLNELRKVVNALIGRYGHPSEVVVEVARELKLSRKKRLEIQRDQREREHRNRQLVDEACVVLGMNPANIARAKRRELSQKMQLWIELNPKDPINRCCPYTGEHISVSRLLSNEVEIEHILPWSMTLDDGLNNKTVSLRRANRDKGNRTPYDAFGRMPRDGYDYSAILERAALMPRAKAKRFGPDGYEQWLRDDKDFLARALNDTAYLSRVAKEYLSLVCAPNSVRAIPGRMTAMLRRHFGLNSILSNSNVKTRDDHRHHAVDAAVVAVTDQGLLKRFADASSRAAPRGLDRLVTEVPLPWPSYHDHVSRAVSHIWVSHKPDHGYQGAMHEETAWGIRPDGRAVRRVRPDDGSARQGVEKKLTLVPISSTRDPARHGVNEQGDPRPYKGYVGGSNYCIEIARSDSGRWRGHVLTTFEAYRLVRELGEQEAWRRLRDTGRSLDEAPLVMRLSINDLIRYVEGGDEVTMRVVKISGNGQVFLAPHNSANVSERNASPDDPFKIISKVAGSLQRAQARRVTVTPVGELKDPGFRG